MRNRSRKHRLTQREPCAVFVPQPSQSTVFFRLNSSHTDYWDNQRHPEIRFPFLPNISRRETSDITLAPSKISDPSYVRTHALDNAGTAKLGATTKILHQTSLLMIPSSSAHHWAGAAWWWRSRPADRAPQVALSYEEPRMYGYTGGAVVYSIRANTTNVESGTWSPGDARHTQALIRQFSLIEAERAQTSSPAPGPRVTCVCER